MKKTEISIKHSFTIEINGKLSEKEKKDFEINLYRELQNFINTKIPDLGFKYPFLLKGYDIFYDL